MVRIIGVSGKFRSGKGTVANILAERFSRMGYNPYHRIFAGKLKEIVEVLTSVPMSVDIDNKFIGGIKDYTQEQKDIVIPEYGMSIGQMLQYIGTDMFRDMFDINTWIKALFREWDSTLSRDPHSVLVIPDTRFPNEADVIIEKYGGLVIRVDCDMMHGSISDRDVNHPSETALDNYGKFSYRMMNDGSLADLNNKVNDFFKQTLKIDFDDGKNERKRNPESHAGQPEHWDKARASGEESIT